MKLKVIAMLLIFSNVALAGQALVTEGRSTKGVIKGVETEEGKKELAKKQGQRDTVQQEASAMENRAQDELNNKKNKAEEYGELANGTLKRKLKNCDSSLCNAVKGEKFEEVLRTEGGNESANTAAYHMITELNKSPAGHETEALERGLRASNKDPERVKRDCGG